MRVLAHLSITIVTFISMAGVAGAQTAPSSSSSLQTQDSGAQPTAPLQNDTAKVQQNQNPDIFSKDQGSSLKVYGDPNTSSPSAEVGASATTNQPTDTKDEKTNYGLYVITFATAFLIAVILYLIVKYRDDENAVTETDVVKNTKIDREAPSSEETIKKPKSKTKKKKKKKAHR